MILRRRTPIGDWALRGQSPVPANGKGGRVTQAFTYDVLHRLVGASGTWTQPGGKDNRYSLELGYDTIHNMTRKTQHHVIETPGGAEIVQKETTYDLDYAYEGGRPHAPSRVGPQRFAYDASGRMVIRHQTAGRGAPTRTLLWDANDRVRAISDGGDAVVDEQGDVIAGRGRTTEFVYDDAGVRVFKRGAQGETAYVNQYFTLRNGTVATKHVFVGTTRISSKLVPGKAHSLPTETDEVSRFLGKWWMHRSQSGWDHARNVEKNPHYQGVSKVPNPMGLPESNFIYFYHPDHIGSTSFVTDGGGEIYEHLQYFPFGELWADERSNTERLPYLFSGKELDQETDLYDFGARYYDPKVSFWLSPDPILGEYLDSDRGLGGIYNPFNLGLYTYTHLNPVRLTDPDGRSTVIDSEGMVLSVRDDQDLGIYQSPNSCMVGANSCGYEKVGETLFWDSFTNGRGVPMGRVNLGQDIKPVVMAAIESANELGLSDLARESGDRRSLDIKYSYRVDGSRHNAQEGFLFDGKYITLRDAGNIIFGINTWNKGLSRDQAMKAAGAWAQKKSKFHAAMGYLGVEYGDPPYYGEDPITGSRVDHGFEIAPSFQGD